MSVVQLISEFVGKLLLSVTVLDCASSSTTLTDVVPRSMPRTKSAEQLSDVAMTSKEITTFVQSEENVQNMSFICHLLHRKINCSLVVHDPI